MTQRNKEREYFSDAAYGLFIHFGLYAIPGGIWQGKRAPHGSEWIMRNLEIPLREYRKLAETFNPTELSAQWYVHRAKE
jgi:alpha-L-fucosidase